MAETQSETKAPQQLWMSYDTELEVWFHCTAPPRCYRDKDITEPPTEYVCEKQSVISAAALKTITQQDLEKTRSGDTPALTMNPNGKNRARQAPSGKGGS